MKIRKPAVLLVMAFAFVVSIAAPVVHAQQNNGGSGSGLQLSPTRTEISGQPGERKTFKLTLKNVTQSEVTAQVALNDFESDGASGTPKIIVDTKQRTPYTLNNFLKNFNDVDLKAGESKDVNLAVEIPANAAPGAYFGALRYAAVPKGQNQSTTERQVALTASVAHLVFVEVPGDVNEQIAIDSLKASRSGKSGSFFLKKPDQIATAVKNQGNGFSRPFGKVSVNGWFGKEVYSYDVNNTDPRGIVLPKSSRTFLDSLKNVKLPGKYNLTASIAYGNGGEVVTYKSSFIYMPIWAIITLLVLIAAIAGGLYYVYRKRFAAATRRAKKRP